MKRKQTPKKSAKPRWLTLKKAFFISLIIHMLCLGGIGCPGCGGGGMFGQKGEKKGDKAGDEGKDKDKKKEGEKQGDNDKIKEKPKPVEIKVVHVHIDKSNAQLKAEAWARHVDECKNFFGGVGIQFSAEDGTIETVYANYPGDEAGLKAGDVITDEHSSIRGDIGTPVTIHVLRNGTPMTFQTHRGKICLEDAIKDSKEKP